MSRGQEDLNKMKGRLRTILVVAIAAVLAALAVVATAAPASKPPIKIMVISSWDNAVFDFSDVPIILGDAAAALNKQGGINGANVQVIPCNEKFDGNEAENCARAA